MFVKNTKGKIVLKKKWGLWIGTALAFFVLFAYIKTVNADTYNEKIPEGGYIVNMF